MKSLTLVFILITSTYLSSCTLSDPELDPFNINGTVIPKTPDQVLGDHIYIYGFKKGSSTRYDRFEFSELVELRNDGSFSFNYKSSVSDKQAKKTEKNYILISGEPLINNPERLVWNRDYQALILQLDFN